jgi:hypothetical protein
MSQKKAAVFDMPDANCDLCAARYESPSIRCGGQITITLKDPPEWEIYGRAFQLVTPYTYNQLAKELNESGWTSEVIHGKQMIICPSCGAKSSTNGTL